MHFISIIKKNIPNTFTLLSLTGGMLAIIFVFHDGLFRYSPYIIFLCALFDFLDGLVARLLKAYSDLGKELDSLADVVSFGVAPGIFMFRLMENEFIRQDPLFHPGSATFLQWILLACPFFIPAFSALRLATFNLDTTQKSHFKGLPTPASALVVVFLFLFLTTQEPGTTTSFFANPVILAFLSLTLSFLMVSHIRMISLKFRHYNFKGNETRYLLLVSALALILTLGAAGGLLTMLLYVILSFLFPPQE